MTPLVIVVVRSRNENRLPWRKVYSVKIYGGRVQAVCPISDQDM